MKHIKLFEEINQINQRLLAQKKIDEEEIDYDSIFDRMRDEHGWGDGSLYAYQEPFENSEYYTPGCTEDEYLADFHSYVYDIQTGQIDDPEFQF